jgi:hypothetical protein
MNEEEQRIAILKVMGWTETEPWLDGRRCFERADSNGGWNFDDLPDYLNDLNAMHEVERALNISDEQITYWKNTLEFVCNRDNTITLMATAAQRAEAYLRTIGKWEGGRDES